MSDSRNQPELETLSYKPEHAAIVNRYGKKRSRVKQPTPMGFNSAVIKPETRVNKGEVAEQSPPQMRTGSCPNCGEDWRTHNYSCNSNTLEQPNKILMIIEEMEGLMSQVNDKLWEIPLETLDKRNLLIKQALEDIDIFQKTTLFELRKAFE
jgi:hypothetical protein